MAPALLLGARAILHSITDVDSEIRSQWSNPGDIFSLLLLIGGDIIQKALGQLVGSRLSIANVDILLTPVAFSFGWVAYAYSSLTDIVGEGTLMPQIDVPSLVINCSNGFVRDNRSWILGRVLRDHEKRTRVEQGKVSIRIDVFEGTDKKGADRDRVWWISWLVILLQQIVAALPWMLYGDWSILFVTLCGTIGALATGMLPQWAKEKWASPRLECGPGKRKIMALTRGNGHTHVMLFVNRAVGWDVEAMASANGEPQRETRYVSLLLTGWWTLLLITCSGLHDHTWFLIGVGGLGMLQNIYVAGSPRPMSSFNFHYTHYSTIIGTKKSRVPVDQTDNSDADDNPNPLESIGGVMGALIEVERKFPGAGASLIGVFFPSSLGYDKTKFPFTRERKFWKYAYKSMEARKQEKYA